MNIRSRILSVLFAGMWLLLISSAALAGTSLPPFGPDSVPATPDYTDDASWLARSEPVHPVDIFWVYPTVLHDTEHWLMDSTTPDMIRATQNTITRQASVFMEQANLFAPYYRQMNMAALSLSEKEQDELLKYGLEDVWQALNYYLNNLNQGRPFILAGHSQGSDLLNMILVKHWGTLGVEKQLVAGYIIGWSITKEDLAANPAMEMCENATQVNCFISYNTMEAGRQNVAPTVRQNAIVTNPLTWTTDSKLAPASLNLGAKFFNADGTTTEIKNFTSAQGLDSGLVVEPADRSLVDGTPPPFPKGVYHVFDYSLFYENLKKNVAQRVHAMTTN